MELVSHFGAYNNWVEEIQLYSLSPSQIMATSPAVNFHGPALVGIFVASILQGMCLIQALTYYERFPK